MHLLDTAQQILYRYSLASMPLGLAMWLAGMHLRNFHIAAAGVLLTALGAYAWTDDQSQQGRDS